MAVLVGGLILALAIVLLTYFLRSNNYTKSNIPYATYGSYPIVGHLFAFLRDRKKLLLECRQRYGECYRIRVFNQQFTIISSHADWMNVIKNPCFHFAPLDFATQLFDLSPSFKFQPEFDAESHRLYVQHLINREGLRPMIVAFIHQVRRLMTNEKEELVRDGHESKWISTGLLKLSHHMLYKPSTLALMGDIEPTSIENDFCLFDRKFHYLIVPFPRWFASRFLSREYKARSHLNEFWLRHSSPSGSSQFHQDRLAMLSSHSNWLTEKDYAGLLTGFFWASLGNTVPGVFWSLSYILRDPKALVIIREEIDKYLPMIPLQNNMNSSALEEWTPEQLDSCVYLESAVNEALRLAAAPLMTRRCRRDAQLTLKDGRTIAIKEGETVAWFGGVSHFDPKLFPQPNEFIFDRFLNRKAENVPGFMPFGAGKSICPGRFFAKSEIKTCTAMLLRYIEYKIEDTERIPSPIQARVGFGIAPPIQDIPVMYRYKT